MERLILSIVLCVILGSCHYRSDNVSDNGEWVSVPADSSVEGYNNIGGQIYWGYIVWIDFTEMDLTEEDYIGADIGTFRVCKGSEYAKDKYHVYYPQVVICFDGLDCYGTYAEKIVLKGAIPSQFKYIGNGYAVSGNKMFHDGEVIEWDDSIANSIYNRHA